MANANSTTLPEVSRRVLLAQAVAIPLAVGATTVPANAVRAAARPSALVAAMEAYHQAEAAYGRVSEPLHRVTKELEPLRIAMVEASDRAASVRKRAAAEEFGAIIEAELRARGLLDRTAEGYEEAVLQIATAASEEAAQRVGGRPEVIEATIAREKASSAWDVAARRAGRDRIEMAVEEANDAASDALDRVESAKPADLREFLQKLELLANVKAGSAFEMVDFFDLAMNDLAHLEGNNYRPQADTECIQRACRWGWVKEDQT